MKILIVEDELRIRNGLIHLIPKISPTYQIVAEAENGYDGVRCAQDFTPDIVITDICMPKSDGLKMIEEIQALGLRPTFVVLSGYAEFKYAQQAMRLGVKDYLLKPISVDILTETLARLEHPEEQQKPDEKSPQNYSVMVADMVNTIDTQYGQHLRLDLFADKYRMTPEYLSTLFTKETQTTFSNYLKTVRMEKAKELLETSSLKIYEIACRVGYPEQKYFSKVFKEYTGVSAKQYVTKKK
jgi:Response regulator containing CheY-like receiver domain and AraC-type DNA-binding domain